MLFIKDGKTYDFITQRTDKGDVIFRFKSEGKIEKYFLVKMDSYDKVALTIRLQSWWNRQHKTEKRGDLE